MQTYAELKESQRRLITRKFRCTNPLRYEELYKQLRANVINNKRTCENAERLMALEAYEAALEDVHKGLIGLIKKEVKKWRTRR